jgi:hypothetical protein
MAATITHEGGVQVKFTALLHAENNAVGGSPVGLPSIPNEDRIRRVVIRVLLDTIYFTDDGSTPTSSHGFPIEKDETLVYDGHDLAQFKMVSASTSDVRVIYYG